MVKTPISEKYALTIKEAASYFNIGENKLRNMVKSNKNADYLFWNGNRAMIKRVMFEKYMDRADCL